MSFATGTVCSGSLAQHHCWTAQNHTSQCGPTHPTFLSPVLHSHLDPSNGGRKVTSEQVKWINTHFWIAFFFLYSYFCIPLSLMFFWWDSGEVYCSLAPAFPSSQFYSSAERYLVYLLARIEQQLIISLFSASCVLWCLARGFYISCTQIFGRHLMWFSAGEHLGKQSSTQERNHTHQVQCPQANRLTRNLLHFSAAHMCNNFHLS